ncbi:putative bifunctional diguanylate cyclase/phosphodiesterase [Aquipuribacter sp. SD81]|uniref:putative bifunctional diguanylate cyclase/phosphodiesterase n=1 Tax=Aquipuribacter sp. SD81 TaxID=3127703 RepID=UPI003019B53D
MHPLARALARVVVAARTPAAATAALSAGLLCLGCWLLVVLPVGDSTLLPGPAGAALPVALLAMLAVLLLSELGQAAVELRQQSYGFSLTGSALLVGMLFLPPHWVVALRVASAVVAFALQRSSALKASYNAAAYLLDAVLVAVLLHGLLEPARSLTVRAATVTYLSLAVVDVLMTALVLLVIRINVGPLEWSDLTEAFVPGAVAVAVASALGLVCVVLLLAGPVGWVLLVLLAAGSAAAYRLYLTLRRRHADLQLVQGFIDASVGGGEALAGDLLERVRSLLRAGTAQLVWRGGAGEVRLHAEDGTAVGAATGTGTRPVVVPPERTDGLVHAGLPDGPQARWLTEAGHRDALVVDLGAMGGDGVLVLADRLGGEVSRFGQEDLSLARALAGHLVVALQNTELVDRLRWDATHDALTGLPNRRSLAGALELQLGGPPGAVRRPVVLTVGVDRFDEVHDVLGQQTADAVVVELARRVRALPLPGASVARSGPSELAVLLQAPSQPPVELAEVLAQVSHDPVPVGEVLLSVGVSVGAVEVADDGAGAEEVLRRADTALFAARATGSRFVLHSRSLDSGRVERLALLGDLHRALDEGALTVHYQPKLHLGTGTVTGVEALVRWEHPVLGAVGPAVFVPLAESAGLVDRLTDHVLATAVAQARRWADDGLPLSVAVNLSARCLDDDTLPQRVAGALAGAGLDPARLVLEVTETSLMGDPARTLPVLRAVAALGVQLSLDDFGTGYSSLAYLQRLPVHELKVDRSFVQALEQEEAGTATALVRTVLGLATSLGLRVVAEGVESARALAALRDLGCHLVQGYLVSRPVPPDAVPDVVRAVAADPAFAGGQRGGALPAPRAPSAGAVVAAG